MFTGIVETTGEVVGVEQSPEGRRIRVAADFAPELAHGESISVSGACLTVEGVGPSDPQQTGTAGEADDEAFDLFLSEETLRRTYLDELVEGDHVNLERAMPADGRFDGHVVQGHVDGTGEVVSIEQLGDDWTFAFSLPAELRRYVVEKGSITVDGISLTVADLSDDAFAVAIIPATYELTTLSEKSVGDPVHLEVDVVAKYVERLLAAEGESDPQARYAERLASR
ncbi:riboflavin synthase [Halomarina litorea]|uniref:riboflavin synthase n=1 Tax=Halomarina litorea TaxID=2961595 RepID=UPI0020C4E7FF|nr:riboflavin synthase [Halomarina sp. BCD28]